MKLKTIELSRGDKVNRIRVIETDAITMVELANMTSPPEQAIRIYIGDMYSVAASNITTSNYDEVKLKLTELGWI